MIPITIGMTDDFDQSSKRRETLKWIFIQLRSSYFKFQRIDLFESHLVRYDISEHLSAIQEVLRFEPVKDLIEEEKSEPGKNKNSALALIASCCQSIELKELALFNFLKFSLGINFALKSTLLFPPTELDERLALFKQITKLLSKNVTPDNMTALREKKDTVKDTMIVQIYNHCIQLARTLPFIASQFLIPIYFDCKESKKKKEIWEMLLQGALTSYKLWKYSQEADALFDQEFGFASKLFGVLSFLEKTYFENFKVGHFLDHKELKELLTLPNRSFDAGLGLEALFLVQTLSGGYDKNVLMEIRLKKIIAGYNPAPKTPFKDVIKKLLDPQETEWPDWLAEFFENNFELIHLKANEQLKVERKLANPQGNCSNVSFQI